MALPSPNDALAEAASKPARTAGVADQRTVVLTILILFQSACTVFFISDVASDIQNIGWSSLRDLHTLPEMGATVGLVIGILVEVRVLLGLLRRQARLERGMGIAAGALADLMDDYFRAWALTPSEQDIAMFTVKGYSIAEIAQLRGSREATVKTHLNAIYRKAGVSGRGQLVSILIEDLLQAPLVPGTPASGQVSPPSGQGGWRRMEKSL